MGVAAVTWALALLAVGACAQSVVLQLGRNLPEAVAERVRAHVEAAAQWPVVEFGADSPVRGVANGSLVLALGNTTTTRDLVPRAELDAAGAEGFVVRRDSGAYLAGVTVLAGDGNPMADKRYVFGAGSIGAAYAAYHALETVGFGFLHAYAPLRPAALAVPTAASVPATYRGSAHMAVRLWHVHTMHPLELTDLLNGFDIDDAGGRTGLRETFESMLPDWDDFLEWSVANQQNRVEWILLLSRGWGDFGKSALRQERMRTLVAACHRFGMACGVDVPIALQQQHSWAMIGTREDGGDPLTNIRANIDWWVDAGFDFVTTENGFSEFNQGDCTTMLSWMNEATRYLADVYSKELSIKVHITEGQICEDYVDPRTGEPINFNFLPIYADPRLAVSPHTVQVYSYDEPAPTYGNRNFTEMYEFMFYQADEGVREVTWYPETSYWVNYDIQVPLFLPIYAYNRLRDIRYIARREANLRGRVHGQTIFESGWEWGYWLNNVVAARAAYNPRLDQATDDDAFRALVSGVLRPFGASAASGVAGVLLDFAKTQKALMVEGRVNGVVPSDIVRRNGIAYLEGWDTFADVGERFESFLATQPKRLSLLSFRPRPELNRTAAPLADEPDYRTEVQPLLRAMETEFVRLEAALQGQRGGVAPDGLGLFAELSDAAQVLAARATQVYGLYDYASTWRQGNLPSRRARLTAAENALAAAEKVIRTREASYAVPLLRIAGWRPNPTVYDYGYLWQAKSLYYFYRDRDQALAESRDVLSPCFMNVISPARVAFGEGQVATLLEQVRQWADETRPGNHFLLDCVSAPLDEPAYPLDKHPRATVPAMA